MENGKCKVLWDFTIQTDREIYERRPDVIVVQEKRSLPDNGFRLPLSWKSQYQRIRKNWTLPRFGNRVEKNMEHESQAYATSDRCSRNNTHKVQKLVKGNRYWNSDNRVAENCPPTLCLNPIKGPWDLRKLAVTGTQEHKPHC